jgi:hypothetical protein
METLPNQVVETTHKGCWSRIICKLLCVGKAGDLICSERFRGAIVNCNGCNFVEPYAQNQTSAGDVIVREQKLIDCGWTINPNNSII